MNHSLDMTITGKQTAFNQTNVLENTGMNVVCRLLLRLNDNEHCISYRTIPSFLDYDSLFSFVAPEHPSGYYLRSAELLYTYKVILSVRIYENL